MKNFYSKNIYFRSATVIPFFIVFKDIDECQRNFDTCYEGSTCVNSYGGYDCVCPRGLTGDLCDQGTYSSSDYDSNIKLELQVMFFFILDVNECEIYEGICENNSTCNNTFGDYECFCLPGYAGQNCTEGTRNK